MNVFWHELKGYRKSTIGWAVSLGAMAILFLSLYPTFTKDIDASQKILEGLPLPVREALGISLANFFTIFGFFSYLFTFVALAGAVQAMNLGLGIIAKEDNGKTADFLLVKPITRSSVITQKLFAALAALVATNLVFGAVAFVSALLASAESFEPVPFLLITSSLFLIQLTFLALGMLVSVTLAKVKSMIAVTLPVVFGFFIVGSLGALIGNDTVRYITPFKFYEPSYIVQHSQYELRYIVVEAVFVALAMSVTYWVYNHKDIRSAT